MALIITGGRDYKDKFKVYKILNQLKQYFVAVGDCPTGVDKFVYDYMIEQGRITYQIYYADWETHGKAAGPIRNIEMIESNPEDSIVIAFPGGKGTESCVREAKKRGLTVLRVE